MAAGAVIVAYSGWWWFTANALTGQVNRWIAGEQAKGAKVTPTLVAATQGLTPAHQAAFRDLLQSEGMRLKPIMHDAKISRRQAAELFSQPQVDTAAVLAALKQARTSEEDARGELEEKVVAFAAPPYRRPAFAGRRARRAE